MNKYNTRLFFHLMVLFLLSINSQNTYAQSCGDIIYQEFGAVDRVPIEDCADPFEQVDSPDVAGVIFSANGDEIFDTSEVVLPAELPQLEITASATQAPGFVFENVEIYKHKGIDYQAFRFGQTTITEPGTYTIVYVAEDVPIPVLNPLQKLFDLLVPTAHAQVFGPFYLERKAITIEVVEPAPEPVGASSVLFLPGIQASRLYTDGLFGTEDQLWTPDNLFSQDVGQLEMDVNGNSINNVYTRDVLDSVPGRGSIYGELLAHLSDLEAENVISGYEAFAYDWRFSPISIIQNGTAYQEGIVDLIAVVEDLAEQANSGQVTIIGHSNGGLIAKALVAELEERSRDDLIDQIVFIGTPHIGTPKAIGTVLHGYDQSVSVTRLDLPVIEADVAREVINNLPGAYGLLPTPAYFEVFQQPIVGFQNATATAELFESYGPTIDDYGEFRDFVRGEDDLARDLSQSVSIPATVNRNLYQQAVDEHVDELDSWQAPDDIQVTQIVGVGLPTLSTIEYRQVIEDDCTVIPGGQIVCVPRLFLKPYGYFSNDGDETVMGLSAEAYAGDSEVYYVDMENAEESDVFQTSHSTLTEPAEVHRLISDLLLATTSSYSYISNNKPSISTNYNIETLDSPVSLVSTDRDGNRTGIVEENGQFVIKTEIPGSQYFEFGGTKYFIVPSDIERETVLTGEGNGGYTLTLATLESDNQTEINSVLVNATITPSMQVTYKKTSEGYSTLITDYDGDGVTDLETTVDGLVITESTVTTYNSLRTAIDELSLSTSRAKLLHRLVDRSERFNERGVSRLERKSILLINRIISLYKRFGLIDQDEYRTVRDIVKELQQKI